MVTTAIILGWAVAFLAFNWSPAKIFLGDVGSISLGFLFGICMLLMSMGSIKLLIATIIINLYYIADAGITILIRFFSGEKVWEPHLKHFFQRAVQRGLSHKAVVSRIVICNIALMLLGVYALHAPIISVILSIFVVSFTVIKMIY
jgi:Fuc2NAc and GlcNAc transferase